MAQEARLVRVVREVLKLLVGLKERKVRKASEATQAIVERKADQVLRAPAEIVGLKESLERSNGAQAVKVRRDLQVK